MHVFYFKSIIFWTGLLTDDKCLQLLGEPSHDDVAPLCSGPSWLEC